MQIVLPERTVFSRAFLPERTGILYVLSAGKDHRRQANESAPSIQLQPVLIGKSNC